MSVMQRLNVRLGADPELFLIADDGVFTAAAGLIGGDKWNPRPMEREGCALQEDNVSVEFNIPACASIEEFKENINYVLDSIRDEVKGMHLNLSIIPSAVFDELQLWHPQTLQAGCEVDFNAWTQQPNEKPNVALSGLRTNGGHVHASYDMTKLPAAKHIMVRACDVFLGSVLSQIDSDSRRRNLYGMAGAYRPKPYGFEYRVPSNIWIAKDQNIELVYNQMAAMFAYMEANPKSTFDEDRQTVEQAINNSNPEAFEMLNAKYNVVSSNAVG